MRFSVVAPFFAHPESSWIVDHVKGPELEFIKYPSPTAERSWHQRNSAVTPLEDWKCHWQHSKRALSDPDADGIITVFPQLAATAATQMRLHRDKRKQIAWCFNLGQCYPGLKQKISRVAMKNVDRFIVHSTAEIDAYAQWLNLPREQFSFVPLQRGALKREFAEDLEQPFVLSLGSAKRDYRTFFSAVEKLGYPTVVIASEAAVSGLRPPPNVTILSNLSRAKCREYIQKARINVVPIDNDKTASGQVTVIEAMVYGTPVIATSCIGTVDYIHDGSDGLLVPAKNIDALADAIEKVWEDRAYRANLASLAQEIAKTKYSDSGAAQALTRIIREIS